MSIKDRVRAAKEARATQVSNDLPKEDSRGEGVPSTSAAGKTSTDIPSKSDTPMGDLRKGNFLAATGETLHPTKFVVTLKGVEEVVLHEGTPNVKNVSYTNVSLQCDTHRVAAKFLSEYAPSDGSTVVGWTETVPTRYGTRTNMVISIQTVREEDMPF